MEVIMSEKKQERSFGLSPEHVTELTAEFAKTKVMPNPYRSGAYGFTIAALLSLGVNKPHPLPKVHAAFRKAAGADWYAEWEKTAKRDKETGLDADGRFLQNLRVLQRTSDYALKLLQVGREVLKSKGAVIDLSRDAKGGLLVALNTDSDSPVKPGRSVAARIDPEPSQNRQKATGGKGKAKTAAKPKTPQKASVKPRKAAEAK
jgi:hypothetical protein